jgi:hypothetical protein
MTAVCSRPRNPRIAARVEASLNSGVTVMARASKSYGRLAHVCKVSPHY